MTSTLAPRETPITVGSPAPDFTLNTQHRQPWSLSDAVKKGDVVLCFFPLAFTGVCGTEMKCVNDEIGQWQRKGAEVVGISCDSTAALKAWADQLGLKQTLLSDMHREVCRGYGFFNAGANIASRGTVVIGAASDGKGRVKWVQAREGSKAMNWEEVAANLGE